MNYQPLNDRIIVERIEQPPSGIVLTDADKAIIGRVLAVGRGRWHEGEWRHVGGTWEADAKGIHHKSGGEWRWIPGYRVGCWVQPGELVYFNSKWNDTGDDYQHSAWWWNERIHVVQEADIFGKVNA